MPYRRHIREIFGDTFEIYLRIVREVNLRVYRELGWDGPDWRAQHSCHACCYVVRFPIHTRPYSHVS